MNRRWLIGIILGCVSLFSLVRNWEHWRRPAYESHVTGDAGALAGIQMVEEGDCAQAIPTLERALGKPLLEVKTGRIFAALGTCYLTEPDNDGKPQRHKGYLYSGLGHRAQGEAEEARAAFTSALEIDPNYGKAYESLGSLSLMEGRHAEAIEQLEHAVDLDGANPITRANLALAFAAVGRFEEAELQVEQAERRGYKKMPLLQELIAKAKAESAERE